jgi:glycerol-3-phosphate dehydrogenase
MKNNIYEVAIVGAGVVGASIARKLSAYACDTVVLEKEWDVSFGVSKTNSGIIHGGFHYSTSTLKGRLEVMGNIMFDRLQQELHFPFQRCGILVVAFTVEEMKTIEKLYMQGVANKVIGLSAKKNGVELRTRFKVVKVEKKKDHFLIQAENGESLRAHYLVNAAGVYADEVSAVCSAERFEIKPLKGQEFLLDRNAAGLPGKVIFPVPSTVSKGILVIPTPEGTCMVGPTAIDQKDKEDLSTTQINFEMIFHSARRLVPKISERDIITSFAGLRPALGSNDFYIAISEKQPRLIQVAGIQSPGLTAAPAIGEYVKDLLKKAGLVLTERPDFDPLISEVPRIRALSPYEADALVQREPAYGEIICRCESVSEAEIVAAIHRGHTTMDGIKFYTRAQMGRCQGGFCSYKILKILQRETGMSIEEITKRGLGSNIITDRVGDLAVKAPLAAVTGAEEVK